MHCRVIPQAAARSDALVSTDSWKATIDALLNRPPGGIGCLPRGSGRVPATLSLAVVRRVRCIALS